MKTTIDLPDELFQRTKLADVSRNTSIKNLVIEGLERVLQSNATAHPPSGAIERLKAGLHLGGKPLTREQIHAR
jgi:hypothetical protein